MTWYRNSVRQIFFCFFCWDTRSPLHDDGGNNLLFFNKLGWLFDWSRGRSGNVRPCRSRSPRDSRRRLLFGLGGRRLGLKSLRNRLANFLEKISDRFGIYTWSAYKEKRDHWQ